MEKVLSSEEVDAILKVAQEKNADLSELIGSQVNSDSRPELTHALASINELTKVECEDVISSFLRKRITFKVNNAKFSRFEDGLKEKSENHIYCLFHIMPNDYYGLLMLDYTLLHHSINLLYGGHINKDEPIMEQPTKVALLVTEKICELFFEGFTHACVEYFKIDCQLVKTVSSPNLITKLGANDHCLFQEYGIMMDDIEATLTLVIEEAFLNEALPTNAIEVKLSEHNTWRSAIQGQLIDSGVVLNVQLPEIAMKINEFMNLKEGELIPISDPTEAFICLNSVKLFKSKVGQTASKRVAKITKEI